MKILLVNPPERSRIWAGIPQIHGYGVYIFPPLGIMYLQSYLEKNTPYTAEIFDTMIGNLNYDEIEERLKLYNPDVVGITAHSHSLIDVYKIILLTKRVNPHAFVVMGGAHPTQFADHAINLEGVDAIVRWDGEITFAHLIDSLYHDKPLDNVRGIYFKRNGSIIKNKDRPALHDIDKYPYPDRRRIPFWHYFTPGTKKNLTTTMITSRGCPNRCPFCLTYQGAYRKRSIGSVVDEMEECQSLGIEEIHFIDDLFNQTPEWVIEFCKEVIRRKLKIKFGYKTAVNRSSKEMFIWSKEAGCTKIHFGVETGTDYGLKALDKKTTTAQIRKVFRELKEVGIRSVAYFMLGCPHENSLEEVEKTIRFSIEIDPDYSVYAIYSPYPNTKTFWDGVEKGLYSPECWDKFMKDPLDYHDLPVAWEEFLKKEELIYILRKSHFDFYMRPKVVIKNIAGLNSKGEFKRLFNGFLSILKLLYLKPDSSRSAV